MVLNDLVCSELIASSRVKFTISPLGFKHRLECEKFESENVKKVKFSDHILFVTHLRREFDERDQRYLYISR